MHKCQSCDCEITDKDVIALNKKLFDKKVKEFYCLECMADYFGCDVDALEYKIEEFKEEGCTLFE